MCAGARPRRESKHATGEVNGEFFFSFPHSFSSHRDPTHSTRPSFARAHRPAHQQKAKMTTTTPAVAVADPLAAVAALHAAAGAPAADGDWGVGALFEAVASDESVARQVRGERRGGRVRPQVPTAPARPRDRERMPTPTFPPSPTPGALPDRRPHRVAEAGVAGAVPRHGEFVVCVRGGRRGRGGTEKKTCFPPKEKRTPTAPPHPPSALPTSHYPHRSRTRSTLNTTWAPTGPPREPPGRRPSFGTRASRPARTRPPRGPGATSNPDSCTSAAHCTASRCRGSVAVRLWRRRRWRRPQRPTRLPPLPPPQTASAAARAATPAWRTRGRMAATPHPPPKTAAPRVAGRPRVATPARPPPHPRPTPSPRPPCAPPPRGTPWSTPMTTPPPPPSSTTWWRCGAW